MSVANFSEKKQTIVFPNDGLICPNVFSASKSGVKVMIDCKDGEGNAVAYPLSFLPSGYPVAWAPVEGKHGEVKAFVRVEDGKPQLKEGDYAAYASALSLKSGMAAVRSSVPVQYDEDGKPFVVVALLTRGELNYEAMGYVEGVDEGFVNTDYPIPYVYDSANAGVVVRGLAVNGIYPARSFPWEANK